MDPKIHNYSLKAGEDRSRVGVSRRRKRVITNTFKGLYTITGVILIIVTYLSLDRLGMFQIKAVHITDYAQSEIEYIDVDGLTDTLSTVVGQNYFGVDLEILENETVKYSPFVKNAYAQKLFPQDIRIAIEERKPSLLINKPDICVLLDEEAYVVDILEGEQGAVDCTDFNKRYDVHVLNSTDITIPFTLGEQSLFFDITNLKLTEEILKAEGYELSSISFTDLTYTLHMTGGVEVNISVAEDWETQHKRLILVLKEISSQKLTIKSIDVRYERPVVQK